MSDALNDEPVQAQAPQFSNVAEPITLADGTVIRRVFTTRQLISEDDAKRWAIDAPKGSTWVLGSLEGVIQQVVVSPPNAIDQLNKRTESLALLGDFVGLSYVTNVGFEAEGCYLPRYYMDKIWRAFSGTDVTAMKLECEFQIESTGRPISYGWSVIEFDPEGRNQRLMAKHRERRRLRLGQQPQLLIGGNGKTVS